MSLKLEGVQSGAEVSARFSVGGVLKLAFYCIV